MWRHDSCQRASVGRARRIPRPAPRRAASATSNLDRARRVVRPWVILLAAGEGRGFGDFSIRMSGRNIPKQFWELGGQGGMLDWALARAARIAPPDRTLVITRADHARWTEILQSIPARNLVVQPTDRGTAPGVLLALMLLGRLDPDAVVALLPCDHHVEGEGLLTEAIGAAARVASLRRELVVMLGAPADTASPECPWLVPHELASTGIAIARRATLAGLFTATVPDLVADCATWAGEWIEGRGSLRSLYDLIPSRDFNRQVLCKAPTSLAVARIPSCGFTDLGTPARLARFLREQAASSNPPLHRRHVQPGAGASA